ncbi:sulfite exporter TauE/SafE family protein [Pleurocapsales cyanobacterium LEGE 10410]|nr:sulfite exporter TauE/SafE family protein [Pleurocapsales cyanobacterium LEGE 10410]
MLDLLLIIALGFLGSFGHCLGMCGPITIALALSQHDNNSNKINQRSEQAPSLYGGVISDQLQFHFLLNTGRIVSYTLVGAILGGLGSIVVASGQLAGIGSSLRQFMAIFTGILLVWFGLRQINPNWLPRLPFLHPVQGKIHQRLNSGMNQLSSQQQWWTPALLGGVWGLIPCGFLYTAQLKAVETGSLLAGAVTMFGFGLGTVPMMLGVGVSASKVSADRRSQLFRLGGWVTLAIGILTLVRTDAMVDYTGHGALLLLMLALAARPVSRFWSAPLQYRRIIGVGAFVLALAHTAHMLDHSLNWNYQAIAFMLPQHRLGIVGGIISLLLMLPAAITSSDRLQKSLGKRWRKIHLLTVPALILAVAHTVLLGSHYLGDLQLSFESKLRVAVVVVLCISVLLGRSPLFWTVLGRRENYVRPRVK